MIRRTIATALACALATTILPVSPLLAQTKPSVAVPATPRAEARAMVRQLLREGKIIRASDIKRGMRGVARSVFQGTKIEEFPVEALGVLTKVQGGGDLVLIKVLGGPVVQRHSGIIAGMSGSPVYFNGKMLGAIAIGWGFPKEPIGGVTPITEMIESSLPDPERAKTVRPNANAASTYVPRQALNVAGHRIARLVVSRNPELLALSGPRSDSTMTMRPVSTMLQLSGFSEASLPMLRRAFARYGIEPVIGPSSHAMVKVKPQLVPGSSIGVQLVSGDMDQTAVGTVTFRWGKRILAFGHPMFGQGATSLPITTSWVSDIFPSYERSFKLASAIDVVGALQQDTEFAIGGTIGAVADTIPMSINVRDNDRQIDKTYHVRVMKDPLLTPTLLGAVATEAIETTLGKSSDKMVRVGLRMAIDGSEPIVKHDYLYSPGEVSEAALADLSQSLAITQMNEFARGSINRVDLTVSLESVRKTARIKSMFADRNKVKAGETVAVSVVMEAIDNPSQTETRTFNFTVPADAPTGTMRISAGPASDYFTLGMAVGAPPPDPTTLKELVAAYMHMGGTNDLLVQASTPDTYLLIDRKKVSDPSPEWAKLLHRSASTAVGSYNEIVEQRVVTDYSISGAKMISIPVESKTENDRPADAAEAAAAAKAAASTATTTDIKPVLSADADGAAGDDPGDGEDPGDGSASQRNSRGIDIDQMMRTAPFLRDIGLWRRMAAAAANDDSALPGREPGVRPVTPTVGAPTPVPTPTAVPTPTPIPTPIAVPIDNGKGVGRPALRWVQSSTADFLRGTFEGAQLVSEGTIRLSPPTRQLATTTENFVWSVAGDKAGNVYLGTGNHAKIFKIDDKGQISTFYSGDEVGVTALAEGTDGDLYAGVSPGGKVYRFTPDGQRSLVFSCDQTFIWALDWDASGNLLIGTGGSHGALYRVNPRTASVANAAKPLATFVQKHVRAMSLWGNDIFVGTGGDGVLYRVDGATGATKALYQVIPASTTTATTTVTTLASLLLGLATTGPTPGTEITSVAAGPDGVYFGTLSNGTLYRWTEKEGTVAIYPSPQQSIYALQRTASGQLFAASGDKGIVYELWPAQNPGDVRAARVLEPNQLQSTALALSPNGDLLVGTGNNAAAYRVELSATTPEAQSGTYTSAILDAKNTVNWGAIRAIGNAALETRSGNTAIPDSTWSDWQPVSHNDLGETGIVSPGGRYLQYRAKLSLHPGADTPSLSRVEIVYRAHNLPPSVAFVIPRGGEFMAGKQTLTWMGTDPNLDPLTYRLALSTDNGKTWKNIELADDKTNSYQLDTTKLTDGAYRARVVASDAGRNPEDPMTDETISPPFDIDNTPPVFNSSAARRNTDGSISITATATDAQSPLVTAAWRLAPLPGKDAGESKKPATAGQRAVPPKVNSAAAAIVKEDPTQAKKPDTVEDDWQAAGTDDGIFDSRRENIVATIPADVAAAAKGRHIELRVRDAANNVASVTLDMP